MSLVARYLFADEVGSPDAIDAVSGNDGSVDGDAAYNGCSLEVSGSTDSTFASSSHPSLGPETAGSLSAWMSWPEAQSAFIRDTSGSPSGDNGWLMVSRKSGDTLLNQISYRVGGTEVLTGLSLSFLATTLTHYAMTWDASGSALYIAGIRVFTGPPPGPSPIVLPWHFGRNGELAQWFPGRIADFRVYDNKLADADVAALAGEGSPCDPPVDPPAFGWDVYRIVPPGDSIELIATLNDATNKAIRPVRNGPGSGQFTINKNSPNATAEVLAPGNLVKVRIPEIHSDHIFAFFLDHGDFTLLSPDEEGGEEFTFGGAGALSYWDRAIWLSSGFVIPWWPDDMEDPPAGAIGLLRCEAQRMAFYDVGIVGGKEVITDQDFVTVGAYDSYYDRRKTLSWPVSEGGPGGFKRHVVHFMAGEPHDTRWVHPSQNGVTDIRASYAIGDTVLLSDIGDGDKPGQVLKRLYDEGVHASRPAHPIPLMTIDFDDDEDSSGNAWTATDGLEGVTASLGETYIQTIARLLDLGVIDVEMGPDLDMHAYNSQGRDLTSATFASGKVRFEKGVNIADELRRELDDQPVGTFVEVVGTENAIGQAELPDAASRVTREISATGDTGDADALEAIGLAGLQSRLIRSDAIGFRTATGTSDTDGLYLPGPDYSDNGSYWLGDIIRLHTGTGEQDFDEEDLRVYAITIAEDDAGNMDVTLEVGSVLGEAERRLYGIQPPPPATFSTRSQFTDTEAAETDTGLRNHLDDEEDAHDASAVSADTTGFTNSDGDDVQEVLADLDAAIGVGGGSVLDWIVVTDPAYGAVGDNTADDTAAIQAALDATPQGGVCYFPVGVYKITDSLDIPHTMIVRGASSFIGQYTKIRQATGNKSVFINPTTGSQHMTFDGLQITGAIGAGETSSAAIVATQSVYVRNCLIQGFYDGLWLATDGTSADAVFYSTVENSFFDSAQRAGVLLGGDVNNFTWRDCRAADNGYGVYASGGPMSLRFFGGAMELSTVAGLYIDGQSSTPQKTAGVLVTGVYFEQADTKKDIVIGSTEPVYAVRIQSCTFVKSAYSGTGWHIDILEGDSITIAENEFMSSDAVRVDNAVTRVVYHNNRNRNGGTVTLPAGSIRTDPSVSVTPSAVGSAAAGTSAYLARADHVHAPGGAAGGDLSGTYPNPTVVDDSHSHTASTLPAGSGGAGVAEHVHVVAEAHTSDGSTTAFLLDNEFDEGSVAAYNLTSGLRLSVTETLPRTATVGAAGSAGNVIAFDYTPVTA